MKRMEPLVLSVAEAARFRAWYKYETRNGCYLSYPKAAYYAAYEPGVREEIHDAVMRGVRVTRGGVPRVTYTPRAMIRAFAGVEKPPRGQCATLPRAPRPMQTTIFQEAQP